MTKLIDQATREFNPNGKFLTTADFIAAPKRLRITGINRIEGEYPEGIAHNEVEFLFEDNRGEEKIIKDKFWQLFRQIDPLDPDMGDILELSIEEVPGKDGRVFQNWRAKIFRKVAEAKIGGSGTKLAPLPKTPATPETYKTINRPVAPVAKRDSAFDAKGDVIAPKEDTAKVAVDTFGGEEIGSSEVPF